MSNHSICESVDQLGPRLIEVRRYMHQHPELSGLEFETTQYLAQQLEAAGIDYRLGPDQRGLVVDLGPTHAARRLALRADIDAVPVQDAKRVEYRSQADNATHACGHDAHSAMLFGALVSLQEWLQREQPDGAIRAIFQPEEETIRGARRLIEWGVLEGVQAIIGLHVDPDRRVGTVGLKAGPITAQCDELLVEIVGQGGHAARPHETCDPIAAAAQLLSGCYQLVPRALNSHQPVVISFGAINGGDACNVIPASVSLKGTLRTTSGDSRRAAQEKIELIADGISRATGARIEVTWGATVPAVTTDRHLTEMVRQTSRDLLGADNVLPIPHASMGGDDFAFYSQAIPASFIRIGCAGQECGNLPLHNPAFDIDEHVLSVGAKILSLAASRYLCPTTD
ncbi:MAG: amidohydrolase [Mariniblastus sp.]|nr:amidohydrolase [Mariniblastus sp.]